jgi:hypothetical protein
MLRRKKPKMLKKRKLMDVGASRRRVKRSMAILKLHRRRHSFQNSELSSEVAPTI